MFCALLWLQPAAQALPYLTPLILPVALLIHFSVPGLFAFILFGGGLGFAVKVALLGAVFSSFLFGFSFLAGIIFLLLYSGIPILAGSMLYGDRGLERSTKLTALSITGFIALALFVLAGMQGKPVTEVVARIALPALTAMQAASQGNAEQAIEEVRRAVILILPGMSILSLWFIWLTNLLVARALAVRYGFFPGTRRPLALLRFGPMPGTVAVASSIGAGFFGGTVHFILVNTAIVCAGVVALQGLMVAHFWMRAKGMSLALAFLYVLLLIQPLMVLPFVIIGLLDPWLDFRRIKSPNNGG